MVEEQGEAVDLEMHRFGEGEYRNEIEEENGEMDGSSHRRMTLGDYIPVYIPSVERGLIHNSHHEDRFLDFLRARPAKNWFLKSGFVGRFRRNVTPETEAATATAPAAPAAAAAGAEQSSTVVSRRRRFRVPFVRKINWRGLIRSFRKWIKDPANIAFFIWLGFVVAGIFLLGLLMVGALDEAINSSSRRNKWDEVINQILNALFMVMCLYQHPKIAHHLVLLFRWYPEDRMEMRKSYCKDGGERPYERAQMFFVVILLHITCFAQYVLCGLYWGYSRSARPDWAVNVAIGVGIAAPLIAGVYTIKSPLGKPYAVETDEESQASPLPSPAVALPDQRELKRMRRRVVVTSPEWAGGTFDCCDDPTVCWYSFCCTFCVFGWNVERLGFGNMYVHIFTFILLCIAPFLVFSASALSIDDDDIRYIVGIVGIVICLFGLLYGGYWRIQMRKRFKLPSNPCCAGEAGAAAADCVAWQLCWSCALAQEVRTANFYGIGDESFFRSISLQGLPFPLHPLPREAGADSSTHRSLSFPPNHALRNTAAAAASGASLDRVRTFNENTLANAMNAPQPALISI